MPKIPNFPVHLLPNVKISQTPNFLTAFSKTGCPDFDTNCQLAKLRNKIPCRIFSKLHKPAPVIHNNFLAKPNSLTLIMQQELRLPDVLCPGCETRAAACLDCRYLKNETSPMDQANLSILRDSMEVIKDPVDSTKKRILIDYKFEVSPYYSISS